MYLLLTMPAIAPGNHYVLMSEVDMSAALHASDRPAKKQLSPKDATQAPTNVLQSYHDTASHKREWKQKKIFLHTHLFPQCCHIFPQSPLPMNPASAMTTERTTTNSTATNRSKQTVVHNTDKR